MAKTIALVGKHGKGKYAIVDDADYQWLKQWRWHCLKGYPATNIKVATGFRRIRMHQMIIGQSTKQIDHINGDKLDNTRQNLRLCSPSENAKNAKARSGTSNYKGVAFHSGIQRWCARIQANLKRIHIGSFDSEVEAAKAYDKAAIQLHGKFARLNFPEDYS